MFDVQDYIGTINVDPDEDIIRDCNALVELVQLITDDPWLARQGFFGLAGAMERQITYLGGTLRPAAVTKLLNMDGNAVSSATDFRNVKFANEDLPHINDDVTLEDRKGEQQQFIRQLDDRMRRAAVIFVKCVREHDSISDDLQQLSYDGIKAKAEANRQANQLAQQQRQQMEKKYAGIA